MFTDTTNIKVGDMVTAPYYSTSGFDCNWLNNAITVYADDSEEGRTFEFTEEIANTATDHVVGFHIECQA